MKSAPIPINEKDRLVSLYNLDLLDTSSEERFDLITLTATRIFHVPISTLTLVDAKREWFKSCQGLSKHEGERAISFCGHALLSNSVFVIPDTKKDSRFADNPMVTGEPYLRFYAGVPVMSADGQRVGVFCIKDNKPREFSKEEEEILKGLASWAEVEINSRNLSLALSHGRRMEKDLDKEKNEEERSNKLQENERKAMLNVMEDLENAKSTIEIEKVKDEAMLASIGEGLIAVDNKRRIMIINKAAEKMLGWKMKDVIGKEITSLPLAYEEGNILPLDKRPTYLALSTGKTIEGTYYFIRKDKSTFPMALIVTPIKLGGKIIGALDIFRDIAREMEIDRAKSEFVSLASHQLRTPLGVIKWYLEALENENYLQKAPQQTKEYFDQIYISNERILSLVSDLLSVSRIEQGRVKNVPKSVDIIQLVKELLEQMQIVASKKKIDLSLTIQDRKIPPLYIDNLRFNEVIENLISNAIEYTLSSGTIDVVVKKVDEMLFISVKDSGIGISETDQKRLFTKFFRSDKAISHNPEGSGLGLYVVKSYVEGWGGKIAVESAEGKGSTFTVSLPISQKKETIGGGDKVEKNISS